MSICQYKQTWIQARGRAVGGGGVAIGVDPFLSTVLFPIITYWENNKVTPPDFTDSMQKFYVYDFIIISIKIQIFEMRELPPPRIRNLKYVLTVCVLNLSCFTLRCLGWSALPPPSPPNQHTFKLSKTMLYAGYYSIVLFIRLPGHARGAVIADAVPEIQQICTARHGPYACS